LAPDLDPLTVPDFEGRPAIAVLPFDNLSGDPD
jgi:TolB-like protein